MQGIRLANQASQLCRLQIIAWQLKMEDFMVDAECHTAQGHQLQMNQACPDECGWMSGGGGNASAACSEGHMVRSLLGPGALTFVELHSFASCLRYK